MTRLLATALLWGVICGQTTLAWDSLPVTTLVEPSDLTLPATPSRPSWRITITEDRTFPEGAWPEDYFVLRIYRVATNATADIEFPFESTYGYFELDLVDLTNDRIEELVLITGRGRGTSVRGELLRVFAIRAKQLKPLLEVPVSGYFGSGCRWWYLHEYPFEHRKDRPALERGLLLRLDHDAAADCVPFGSPSLIPSTNVMEYGYDPNGDQMESLDHRRTMGEPSNPPSQPAPKKGRG
jgi:hypothetical protein